MSSRGDSTPGSGPAPVASLDEIDTSDAAPAPVALFDVEQVGAARVGVPIAALRDVAAQGPVSKGKVSTKGKVSARGDAPPDGDVVARRDVVAGRGVAARTDVAAPDDAPARRKGRRPGDTADVDQARGSGSGGSGGGLADNGAGPARGRTPAKRSRGGFGSRGDRRPEPEPEPDADPEAAARSICLRLLTDRARTRQELAEALRRKGIPDEAADAVLSRYDEVGLIDDAAFAGQWVRSRHTGRGLGRRAIAVELRRKGVADDVADEALEEVDAAAEETRARQLVDRKLRGMAVDTRDERTVTSRRLAGMLARKGYGAGVAYRVVREAIADRGAELEELGEPIED